MTSLRDMQDAYVVETLHGSVTSGSLTDLVLEGQNTNLTVDVIGDSINKSVVQCYVMDTVMASAPDI